MIKIITDSSSNITREEAEKLGVEVMPLTINFGTEEFRDGIDINCEDFYKKMRECKELPHTSQLTEEQVEEAVCRALKEADEVLIISIASVLSGSYDRCKAVAEKYENVYAYDSKCTTVMLKLCILEALKMAERPVKEVVEMLDVLRPKLKIYAVLDTLENLKKGGRLSKTSALLGSVLKIKPVIGFAPDGSVEMLSKQIGINKGISYIAENVCKDKIDFTKSVFLIYTENDKNSEALINKIGIKYTEKSNICPVIGTHIGSNAAGIVYAEK